MKLIDDQNDCELFALILQGDEKSFQTFYETYFSSVYYHVLKLVKIELVAEEITQEIFVTIWIKKEQVFIKQNFKSYFYAIVHNKVIDFLRTLKRERKIYDFIKDAAEGQFATITTKSENSEIEVLLHQAIERLPDKRKIVFRLSKFENKSYSEISTLLHISKHTINDHIAKANRFLKKHLASMTQPIDH
jgi:RNA polymerase sigma-70 factor (family 1)